MKSLNPIYSALFDESKYFDRWYQLCHFSVLCLATSSIFASRTLLYAIVIAGLLSQAGLLIFGHLSERSRAMAHRIERISMVVTAFGGEQGDFDISDLKGNLSARVHKLSALKAKEQEPTTKYNLPSHIPANEALGFLIQENSYWNHHLFAVSARRAWIRFLFIVVLLTVAALFWVVLVGLSSSSLVGATILMIFLSSLRLWEELKKALIWRDSSASMFAIDSMLRNPDNRRSPSVTLPFANYCAVNEQTPAISQRIYDAHSAKLHDGWATRKEEMTKGWIKQEPIAVPPQ